jgi:Domain of unknown function (DUF4252)
MNDRDTQKQEPAVKSPRFPARIVISLAACAALLLPLGASASDPELRLPDFSHLRQHAVDFTDVTIDGFLLRIARKMAADEQDNEAMSILKDIKSVRVRAFEFDSDDAYSGTDLDSIRQQLAAPGWTAVVQQRSREQHSNVDVYMNVDGDKILGIAVIESEPRSFTVVNVVGNIDIAKLAKLAGGLGLPKVSQIE